MERGPQSNARNLCGTQYWAKSSPGFNGHCIKVFATFGSVLVDAAVGPVRHAAVETVRRRATASSTSPNRDSPTDIHPQNS